MGSGPVAAQITDPTALVDRLLAQINDEKIYDFAFRTARDWTMFDIGANMGLVSLYASDACKRIVALEPSPVFDVLVAVCAPQRNIQPMRMALGGHNGNAEFLLNDVNTTASSMAQTYGKAISVPTVTLSGLIRETRVGLVDFCKVDIEGSELECLTPLEIDRCKPFVYSYFVEVHNCPNSTWEYKMGKLTETFVHAGYRRIRVRGDSIFACTQ